MDYSLLELMDTDQEEEERRHPLTLMARHHQAELLGHPLGRALVRYAMQPPDMFELCETRHKWNKFGQFVFYFNLLYYCIFVGVFTEYVMSSTRPYSVESLIRASHNPK